MSEYSYVTAGSCSRRITFEVRDNIIVAISFFGGCHGNLQGICSLVKGMNIVDVIEKLKGIDCSGKGTSCPDQLARALTQYYNERVNKTG